MNTNWKRAMLTSLILIFSSLAGCLGDGEKVDTNPESLGTVMVSTYHIGELVKSIAGNQVTLEYMSQDNIPVHDYEPSAQDLIRLQSADLFFYHGLGLEPWIENTLESLGSDAPASVQVHTMPDGKTTLDYESMLIAELCELMVEGPFEGNTLTMESDVHPEIHAEYTAYNLSFPEDMHHDEEGHEDHDEDGHEDHEEDGHEGHEGHDEEGHEDHEEDWHEGHGHGSPEETIEDPEGCPTHTVISIFHLEAGEYVLEFEDEHLEDFTMTVLKMGGGHAHHEHGYHGDEDHADEDHADEDHDMCHNADTHVNYESTEEECEEAGHIWMEEDGHGDHEDHDSTPEEILEMLDTNNDSHVSWDEFWASWDDDHEDHNETHDEDHNETHDEDHNETQEDEHEEELRELFNESDLNNDTLLNQSELEHFVEDVSEHVEEHEEHAAGYLTLHVEVEGEYGFALPEDVSFHVIMNESGHDDHAGHEDHDDHVDDEDHDEDHDEDGEEGHDDHDEEALNYDPHSWLDPGAFNAQATLVMNSLIETFPEAEETFESNAAVYSAQLVALDIAYDAAFGENGVCMEGGHEKTVVANHNAYSYISVRYDIQFVTVHGLDPEGEPSPEDIIKVIEHIKEEDIKVLFVEEYTDNSSIQSIVDETGITIQTLYTMEMAPSDENDDYMSMMTKNLEHLVSGIGC